MLIDEIIKSKINNVFFDMDGVLTEFNPNDKASILNNEPDFYLNKRPILCILEKAKILYENNIKVSIMSMCHFEEQKRDKIKWLKKYAPFIKTQNIHIIVLNNEKYDKETKDYLKVTKIQEILKNNETYILIEDNHKIIKATNKVVRNSAHHLSELLD